MLLVARTIRNPVWYTRASIEFHHSNTEIIYGSQNPGWDLVHIQVVQGLPLSPCLAGVFSLFTLEPFQSEVLRNIRCDDQQRHKADDLAWGKEFCAWVPSNYWLTIVVIGAATFYFLICSSKYRRSVYKMVISIFLSISDYDNTHVQKYMYSIYIYIYTHI